MKHLSRIFVCIALALTLTGCSRSGSPFVFEFAATYGDQPISCGEAEEGIRLADLRFFIHDVRLVDADGASERLRLVPDGQWQSDEITLIDLEDGSGECLNGTPGMNTLLAGVAPDRDYRELRFTLGVPADLNHADPLTAIPPLTSSAMHWHWRSGYKFLRAAVRHAGGGFRLHLGSTHCHGVIGNLSGCDAGNRPVVRLAGLKRGRNLVLLDLETLLAGVDLDDDEPQACEMGPDDPCNAVVASLGLGADGKPAAPTAVFRLAP